MNADTIARVQCSFQALRSKRHVLSVRFARCLFAENPAMRPLFPANMDQWSQRFVDTLDRGVRDLHKSQAVSEMARSFQLHRLGRQIAVQHLAIATDTLVRVIAELQQQQWSSELDRAWRSVLVSASQQLVDQSAQSRDTHRAGHQPVIRTAARGVDQ